MQFLCFYLRLFRLVDLDRVSMLFRDLYPQLNFYPLAFGCRRPLVELRLDLMLFENSSVGSP